MSDIARLITFSGRVQGVGFRFTAQRIAFRYELAGFVRNLPDGGVEMLAQGPGQSISDALLDISETFKAGIRDTKIEEVTVNPRYTDFRITY
jgi:acylphosphatase